MGEFKEKEIKPKSIEERIKEIEEGKVDIDEEIMRYDLEAKEKAIKENQERQGEFAKTGEEIAEQLSEFFKGKIRFLFGNRDKDTNEIFYSFNDDMPGGCGSAFSARSYEEAKKSLPKRRAKFGIIEEVKTENEIQRAREELEEIEE